MRKELGHVAGFCGKRPGLLAFGFHWQKEATVFLERRATTRGIRDDRVEILQPKCSQIPSRQVARRLVKSRVHGKSATAGLFRWHDHFAAVGGEHPDGSLDRKSTRLNSSHVAI